METKIKFEFNKIVLPNGSKYDLSAYGSTEEEAKKNVVKDLEELIRIFKK